MRLKIFNYNFDRIRHKVVVLFCKRSKIGLTEAEEKEYAENKAKMEIAGNVWKYHKQEIESSEGFNCLIEKYKNLSLQEV